MLLSINWMDILACVSKAPGTWSHDVYRGGRLRCRCVRVLASSHADRSRGEVITVEAAIAAKTSIQSTQKGTALSRLAALAAQSPPPKRPIGLASLGPHHRSTNSGAFSNFKRLWQEGLGKLAAVYFVSLFGFVIWVD
jgi:hypothetical protein